MAASLKHWEEDNTLYLFTSLTSGSSLILSNTNRIETILLNARIPFTHIDTATDESAKRLFQRRGKGKKLPFLVKEGFVLGTFEEVEEWNEYGELKEMIGEVGTGHERSVETAPANKTLKPVDFSREMGIMPSIQGTLNGANSTLAENVPPKATPAPQQQQNHVMKSLAEEVASAAKSRGPVNLKSVGAKKEMSSADSKAEKAIKKEEPASTQEEEPKSSAETTTDQEVLKSLSEAVPEKDSSDEAAEKTEQAVAPPTVPPTKEEPANGQADVDATPDTDHAQPADVQEHLPTAHGNEDPDLAQAPPFTTSEIKGEDSEASNGETPASKTHEKPSKPVEGTSLVKETEDPDLTIPEPSESETHQEDNLLTETKQSGLGQTSVPDQTKPQAEPAVEKVEAALTSSTAKDKDQPVLEAAQAQVSDAMSSAKEVAQPIAEKATTTAKAVQSIAIDTASKVTENTPSTTEVKEAAAGLGVSLGDSATNQAEEEAQTEDYDAAHQTEQQPIERPSTPPPRSLTTDEEAAEPEPKTPEPPQTPIKKSVENDDTPSKTTKLNPVTPQVAPSKQFKMEKKERKPEDGSPKPIHDQFMHFFF